MLLANTNNFSENEVFVEKIWDEPSFFKEISSDFEMAKVKFPENNLIYNNQAYLTGQKRC